MLRTISEFLRKQVGPNDTPMWKSNIPLDMHNVACVVLGGGQGSRLHPLTLSRCKPAISFGGRYRLIDVPVSNSINSHIQKIFVVTQFLSSSLHRHLFQTYRNGTCSSGFIELLGAEQKPEKVSWYQGTADAVRQNIEYLIETPADYFLILSGDQLYHINFQRMVLYAIQKDVDVLVATLPVDAKDAKRMGIMKINEDHHITEFFEKPSDEAVLERLKTAPAILEKMGLSASEEKCFLGSMGIYLFKREALFDLLKTDPREDFGKHLIPSKVKAGSIAAFPHEGYWEDIGTIESFYQANMALTQKEPPFNCYDESNPIYTNYYHLPAPKVYNTHLNDSIICEGAVVEADEVSNSILGPRAVVKRGSIIKASYVMGNDFYTSPIQNLSHLPERLFIDENCIIKNAIIDKNAYIGKNVQLINKNNIKNFDGPNIYIRDGIIVVPRGANIPDGFAI